jgi:DNA-binding transcriptional regulator YdaS (Cro superfamily)
MDDHSVYARAISIASVRIGGIDKLAEAIGVSPAEVARWVDGHGQPEMAVFLRILAIALEADSAVEGD